MIDLLAAKRRCVCQGGVLRVGIGGSSKSANQTTNNDARITAGENSTNASVTGNDSSVVFTDHAAVAGALDLAKLGVEGAYTLAGAAQASSGGLLTGALDMANKQNQQFASTVENIKTADVRVLIIVGLGVVGLAAVFMAKKG